MKKWLLAIMVCLSFASLTAGLVLLPQAITYITSTEHEEESDEKFHTNSVNIRSNNDNYGTVTSTYYSGSGVRVYASSENSPYLRIGSASGTIISTAVPKAATSSYVYKFLYWQGYNGTRIGSSGFDNVTSYVTACFARYSWTGYKVSINTVGNGSGSVSPSSFYVASGSQIYYSSNKLQVYNSESNYSLSDVCTATASSASAAYSYSFDGYYIDYNCANKVYNWPSSSRAITSNTTYYAKFTATEKTRYTVSYDFNGGNVSGATSVNQFVYKDGTYSSYTTPPSPVRAGYTLRGWSINLATTISSEAKSATRWESSALSVTPGHYYTLAAMWNNGTKYVSLRTRGFVVNGSDVKTGKYEVESGVYSLKAYVEVSSSTSASELMSKLDVTIREMNSDGSIDYMPVSTFASTKIKVNKSHTLIANWTTGEVPYAIYLNAGSHAGSATTQNNITYGQKVPSLPTPSVDSGYTFSGWYTTNSTSGGKKVSAGDTFNENSIGGEWNHSAHTLTLYSRATPAYYTITLNTNGGTGGSSSVYAKYLSSSLYSNTSGSTTTPSAPSRTGYTFGGWTVTKDGTDVLISSSGALQDDVSKGSDYYTYEIVSGTGHNAWAYTGNVTAYAKWTAKKYKITLNVNGATGGMTSNKDVYAQYNSNTLYANDTQGNTTGASWTNPTRTNYTFGGWSTSSALGSGTVVINTGKNLVESTTYTNSAKAWIYDGAVTFYAQWKPVKYTVNVKLRKVGGGAWDGSSFNLTYTKATDTNITVENTSSTADASYDVWEGSVMTFQAALDDALFLGVTTSDSAPTTAPHIMGVDTYTVTSASSKTIYLWKQVIRIPLRLANDERGWWWYLEDGRFPQSYVGDTMNGTLNGAGLTSYTEYDFGAGQKIKIYTYGNDQYAKVAGNGATILLNGGTTKTFASGTNYWFKVEPIKWRVSKFYTDYNTAIAAYPNVSYSNMYGVSDMLGYGYMTTGTVAAGTKASSFAGSTLSYGGVGFDNDGTISMSIGDESFKADGTSEKVMWGTRNASQSGILNVADAYSTISGALKGVTFSKYSNSFAGTFDDKFYASDLTAFFMGMNYNNARAWTTDLYNLGSGYVIMSSGSMQTSYFNENYGYIFAHKVATATNCGLEYKAMNYIQSNGSQWIDSGASIAANTWVETDLMFTDAWSYNMMFGAWSIFSVSLRSANAVCAASGGSNSQNIGSTTTTNTKYRLQFGAAYAYTQNGVRTGIGGSSNTASDRHILLFAASNSGNQPYSWSGYGKGRIYTFKIYNGSTLVRDFVPVQNLKTGAYGLFDKVNKTFYGNSGSGAFTAG